jgi:AcrR family transcriptional regulator
MEQANRGFGRPRLFDAVTERQMLLSAGLTVMRRNGYLDATVADVLAEAGLSSRAFYRHFDSKDALLLAMFRRDADTVGASLLLAVETAEDPLEGLNAWLDGYLDVFFEPRRAARVAVMASEGARRAVGYDEELARVRQLLIRPLVGVLQRGTSAGVLTSAEPDAWTILAVVGSVCGAHGNRGRPADRGAARRQAVRFCWPALGLRPDSDN